MPGSFKLPQAFCGVHRLGSKLGSSRISPLMTIALALRLCERKNKTKSLRISSELENERKICYIKKHLTHYIMCEQLSPFCVLAEHIFTALPHTKKPTRTINVFPHALVCATYSVEDKQLSFCSTVSART